MGNRNLKEQHQGIPMSEVTHFDAAKNALSQVFWNPETGLLSLQGESVTSLEALKKLEIADSIIRKAAQVWCIPSETLEEILEYLKSTPEEWANRERLIKREAADLCHLYLMCTNSYLGANLSNAQRRRIIQEAFEQMRKK